jgi:ferritin
MIKPHKLEQKVVDILLERLVDETAAFYHYRALSNWCENVGYIKAAEYFATESADELVHAKKIEKYLVDWNVTPKLPEILEPKTEFSSLVDGIESSYKIEYQLYSDYEDNAKTMMSLDLCTFALIQELLSIQLKSVAEYSTMINILEGVEPTKFNLLLLEKKLF